jgi:hypothetical protein
MNKNNAVLLGISAILALAVSLPLVWMTIHEAHIELSGGMPGFRGMPRPSVPAMNFEVTGINGHITFLAKVPIWLIVVVGMAGVLLALLNGLGAASLSRVVPLIPLSAAAVYILIALVIAVGSEKASVGAGVFVALIGLGLGYVHALAGPTGEAEWSG